MNKLLKLATGSMLAVVSTSSVFAQTAGYAEMHKQLNIMNNIMKSSLNVPEGRKSAKITGINSTYLVGQGIVFTINSSSKHGHFGSYNFNFTMPELPVVPVAPVAPTSAHDFNEIEISSTISDAMEQAFEGYELAFEVLGENREVQRELRESQRELAYEVRDIERAVRDIEFQKRHADDQQKKALEAQLKALEERRNKFEKSSKVIEKQVLALTQKQEAEKAKQEKERDTYYDKLSYALADTLCLYGNGLKALPKSERVSVILKSGGEKVSGRYKDKIFVFNKSDISACSIDKISTAQLLEKGKGYQF